MLNIAVRVKGIGLIDLPVSVATPTNEFTGAGLNRFFSSIGDKPVKVKDLIITSTCPWSDIASLKKRLAGMTFDELNDFAWETVTCFNPDELEQELITSLPLYSDVNIFDLLNVLEPESAQVI